MSDASVKNLSNIVDKSVFITVRFGLIGNTRRVKAERTATDSLLTAQSIAVSTDADIHLLKVQKTLLESPELDAIRKADGKIRVWLYDTCLPYEMGIMILPVSLLENVHNKLEAYRLERTSLVNEFVDAYPALCKTAVERLGSLYNPTDYPAVDSLAEAFTYDWQYISFAVPEHLKQAGLFEAESAKMQEKFQAAAEEITLVMRQTLLDTVSHLQTALTPSEDGKQKRLFTSAVSNVQDFLATFDARNITNDTELSEVVAKARALVDGVSVETLRKNDDFKEKLRAGMETISGQLIGLVEVKTTRKFRD